MPLTVAIHQPNFFPWLGFFKKWDQADVLILLDDVKIQRTGGSWTNRTAILLGGEKKWISVPIKRSGIGAQAISQVGLADAPGWKKKLSESFRHAYSKYSNFSEAHQLFDTNLEHKSHNLLNLNRHGLEMVGAQLGMELGRLVFASSLGVSSSGTQRLVDLVKAVEGTRYLSGDGAAGYQQNELFALQGLELQPLNFVHPTYNQRGAINFTPGLSVLDAIANLGAAGTRSLLSGKGK
jgi:hypothetical protein